MPLLRHGAASHALLFDVEREMSQCRPLKPTAQKHKTRPGALTHVAPLRHGVEVHKSTLVSHTRPV